jgi:hypothetical protein
LLLLLLLLLLFQRCLSSTERVPNALQLREFRERIAPALQRPHALAPAPKPALEIATLIVAAAVTFVPVGKQSAGGPPEPAPGAGAGSGLGARGCRGLGLGRGGRSPDALDV